MSSNMSYTTLLDTKNEVYYALTGSNKAEQDMLPHQTLQCGPRRNQIRQSKVEYLVNKVINEVVYLINEVVNKVYYLVQNDTPNEVQWGA